MCNWCIVEFSSRGQLCVMIGTSIAFSNCCPYNQIREEGDICMLFVCDLSSTLLLVTPIKKDDFGSVLLALIKYMYFVF